MMTHESEGPEIVGILSNAEAAGLGALPRYSDKAFWQRVSDNPMLAEGLQSLRERSDSTVKEPIVHVPVSLYLSYSRTGSRSPHDGLISQRRANLESFMVAECLERKGRFADAIVDHIWAICEESSWVIPAHSRGKFPEYREFSWIDLFSASTALDLAQALSIYGEELDRQDPAIRERMIHEMYRRCWKPYMERDDFWWLFPAGHRVNNWTAVCNCGVVGSALLAMDDTDSLSFMIEKCLASMRAYLGSFGPKGGCDEGASYWSYGVGNYAWLSYLMEGKTGGRITLMDEPIMREIAIFPLRVTLCRRKVANFSDCSPEVRFPPSLFFYLSKRLRIPRLKSFAQHQYNEEKGWTASIRDIMWMDRRPCRSTWRPRSHIYLPGIQWMISRSHVKDTKGLILAAKGGNNGENHNQNDVGNFIVMYGCEGLIIDLGSGTYTSDYFTSKRYSLLFNSSRGHNVPLIDGHEQAAGPQYSAHITEHRAGRRLDLLSMEIGAAYPREAGIRSLLRTISFHREGERAWVEVDDCLRLRKDSASFVLPLHTWGEVRQRKGAALIRGTRAALRIDYSPPEVSLTVEEVDLKDKKFERSVRRIVLDVPVRQGRARLTLRLHGAPS